MARRIMGGLKRPLKLDVKTDALEDEFISRDSYDLGMSKAEYLRTGRIPNDRNALEGFLVALRKKQKGIKGILRRDLDEKKV